MSTVLLNESDVDRAGLNGVSSASKSLKLLLSAILREKHIEIY